MRTTLLNGYSLADGSSNLDLPDSGDIADATGVSNRFANNQSGAEKRFVHVKADQAIDWQLLIQGPDGAWETRGTARTLTAGETDIMEVALHAPLVSVRLSNSTGSAATVHVVVH